jgi:uncharacterized protein YkwD
VLVRPRRGTTRGLLAAPLACIALGVPPAQSALASPATLAPVSACPGQADAAAPLVVKVHAMECLVNWARRSHGLSSLRDSRRLDRSSRLRALAIRRCQQFSHTPCGQSFGGVFVRAGYRGWRVGENIAWGGGPLGSARSTFERWLASPPHRQTIFARAWRDFGVGVVRASQLFGAQEVSVWVAHFGRR